MNAAMKLTALALGAVALLGGCGSDDPAEPATTRIEVTFADGDVSPQGDRLEVKAGGTIEFTITADEPGSIHVHSSPEQEFEYDAGTNTYEITIDTPGVVDIESHDPETVIVQLEVS
jgi:plastocyanin